MRGAAHQLAMHERVLVDGAHGDALVVRQRLAQPVDAMQHVEQIEALVREIHALRLDLAHVEHVVDQREQLVGRTVDLLQANGHAPRLVHVVARDADHADDAVDGRADVMTHAAEELRFRGIGGLSVLNLVLQQALLIVHEDEQHGQRHAHVRAGQRGEEELQDGARNERDDVDEVLDQHAAARGGALAQIADEAREDGAERVAVGQHEHEYGEQRAAHVGAVGLDVENPPRPQRRHQHDGEQEDGDMHKVAPTFVSHDGGIEAPRAETEEEVRDAAAGQVEHEIEDVVSPEAGAGAHAHAQRVGQGAHARRDDQLHNPDFLVAETRRARKLVHQQHVNGQQEQHVDGVI